MGLYLYDDARARQFEPFALTRPASELCTGARITRHRWAELAREPVAGLIAARHLRDFAELDSPPVVSAPIPAGARIGNSRCLPAPGSAPQADVWVCDGRVAAVRLDRTIEPDGLRDGAGTLDELAQPGATRAVIAGSWVDEVWDLLRDLPARLEADIPIVAAGLDLEPGGPAQGGVATTGSHRLYIERGAVIEPHTFFDLTPGPVLVRRGATVQAFTRVVGPCVIGLGSVVGTDRIGAASIGEACRVHGELWMSIVLGNSNKSHDGFVGHSYLGRWVNLGAGTITSNLKNTYGPIQLRTPSGVRNTGLTFLGSFIGDYARTGIGAMLTTGSVIGAGANLLALAGPKYVPPFAWGSGEPFETFSIDKFLEVAERQMARRQVPLSDGARRCLRAAHAVAIAGR
jgi:UDP-N-acetylglucosamine diphosphorylase/glucosamine-1-phosphate N-acetyltransferase